MAKQFNSLTQIMPRINRNKQTHTLGDIFTKRHLIVTCIWRFNEHIDLFPLNILNTILQIWPLFMIDRT